MTMTPALSLPAATRRAVLQALHEDLVRSGASNNCQYRVLHLIARCLGVGDAQEVVYLFDLELHQERPTPLLLPNAMRNHGDAEIQGAQEWLATHFSAPRPVDEMMKRSRLAERTFKRRFTAATGMTPIAYAQRLRIEDAKRRLERTDASVEDISWRVGYEDSAFFRRLFKRMTGLAPGAYRKRFRHDAAPCADRTHLQRKSP